jgi:hypothetical protein
MQLDDVLVCNMADDRLLPDRCAHTAADLAKNNELSTMRTVQHPQPR